MIRLFRNKLLTQLRNDWQFPKSWERESSSIEALYRLSSGTVDSDQIDNKTWHDLDMDAVFRKIDRTMTSIGQQYLYNKLRILNDSTAELRREFQIAESLKKNQALREALQTGLNSLGVGDARQITKPLFGKFETVQYSKVLVSIGTAISAAIAFSAFYLSGSFLLLLPLLIVTNFYVSRRFEEATDRVTDIFPYLYRIVATSESISKIETDPDFTAIVSLRQNVNSIKSTRRKLKTISINQNHDSLVISNFMYLLNLLIPYDLLIYTFTINNISNNMETMRLCFLSLGSIDSSISNASYLHTHADLCNPQISDNGDFRFEDLRHPLLETCVPNSLNIASRSFLITGSNMSGKTTFIKSIGVNLILARTLWICHAALAVVPRAKIFSSIKTEDSLEKGESFYFSELKRMKFFLEESVEATDNLFLIDEIYRGTNTSERIAGSASVLQELAQKNIVIVTTHDVELADLLSHQFDMLHFEETGIPERPFDYQLKIGVCKTRNAIKLMENLGYPHHIIDLAREYLKLPDQE